MTATIGQGALPAAPPPPAGRPDLVRRLRAFLCRLSPGAARTPRDREAAWIRQALLRRGFTEASDPAVGFAVDASGDGEITVVCGPQRLGAYRSALQHAGFKVDGLAISRRQLLVTPRRSGR